MIKIAKSLSCVLLAIMLTLSVAVLPAITAHADEAFDHPLSESATAEDKAILDELKGIGAAHITSFDVNDFRLPYHELEMFGDKFVDDPAAYNGKAAALFAAGRVDEKNNFLVLPSDETSIPIKLIPEDNTEIGVTNNLQGWMLNADGNYHLYKLENIVVHKGGNYQYLIFFNDWGFQIKNWGERLAHTANKFASLYVSMKIEGDVSSTDPSTMATYYIDRVIVADYCSNYDIPQEGTVEPTCTENGGITGTCPACGATAIKYEIGTRLDHVFTNYVTDEDGNQVAECDYGCGKKDVIKAPKPETVPAPETEPADNETEPTDETEVAGETDKTDTTGGSTNPTLIVLIIVGVVFVALIGVAMVVVLKNSKKNRPNPACDCAADCSDSTVSDEDIAEQ